jgi:hypothetical protein
MAIIVQGRAVSIPSGQRQLSRDNVPDTLTMLLLTLRYCTTATPLFWANAATILRVTPWLTLDGGVTWKQRGFWETNGGIHLDHGVEVPESTFGFSLLPGTNRELRLDVEVLNGPLASEVDVVAV